MCTFEIDGRALIIINRAQKYVTSRERIIKSKNNFLGYITVVTTILQVLLVTLNYVYQISN